MRPKERAAAALGFLGVGAIAAVALWPRRERGNAKLEPAAGAHDEATDDEIEALARVITSEANRYSEAERIAIAWTVRNRARRRRTTIAQLVCNPCGHQGRERPFSSAQRATTDNIELARRVLAADESEDPTGGAVAFFEPRVQDRLVAEGRPGYRFTSAELRAKWQREGQEPRGTVGAFEFFA